MNLLRSLLPVALAGASVLSAQAGSFGGPGPFRNGSPLPSGTNGTYQAVATGTNATGIISFSLQNGVQTTSSGSNAWVFFVDGETLTGRVSANVSEGKVTGILDSDISTSLPTNPDGSAILPIAFIIAGNSGSGTFSGDIDLNSPVAAFHGEGQLTGTPEREDQLIYIIDLSEFDSVTFGPDFTPIFQTTITVPGSSLDDTPFKFRGTRLSTSVVSTSSTSSTTGTSGATAN